MLKSRSKIPPVKNAIFKVLFALSLLLFCFSEVNAQIEVTREYAKRFNLFKTWQVGGTPGQLSDITQVRFTFTKDIIKEYREKPKLIGSDWVLVNSYEIVKSFEKYDDGYTWYEYQTSDRVQLLTNDGNPETLIIRKGNTLMQYAFYVKN